MDAVAELVKRKSVVGKTAVCGLDIGSVIPMFSCIGTNSVELLRFGGVFRVWVNSSDPSIKELMKRWAQRTD